MASPVHRDKRNPKIRWALGFLLSLFLSGCSTPPLPPEAELAERVKYDLWKAQAHVYAPEESRSFEAALGKITEDLIKEQARFVWFRNYGPIAVRLRTVLNAGEEVLKKSQERKEAKRIIIARQLSDLEERIKGLDRLSLTINEGRLARSTLTKGSLMVREAALLWGREDYDGAASRLTAASDYINASEDVLSPIFNRYADKALIKKWKMWAEAVVAKSRENGTTGVVVSKIDRSLTLYRQGRPLKTYEIGIGMNGLADKRQAGDRATPEGSYRIIKKIEKSRYHKALLLNYPNDEDREEFLRLKKRGSIPKRAGIGGLIEIHGGGSDGMTYGCVSLEDRDMDEVFEFVPLGSPVAIVGADSAKKETPLASKKAGDDE